MSNASITRKYKGPDAEMILASATILDSALARKEFLQSKRPAWTDTFFDALRTRIDDASRKYLGKDSAKDLRQATQDLNDRIGNARTLLSEFKVQVEEDFKKTPVRRDEILKTLGFSDFQKQVRDQSALISLLFRFNQAMTRELKDEVSAKGIAPEAIEAIQERAAVLYEANQKQEFYKTTRKELTQSAITELNDLYDDVISICNISARFLRNDPAGRSQFSFSGVMAAQTASATPAAKKAARKAIARIDAVATTNQTS